MGSKGIYKRFFRVFLGKMIQWEKNGRILCQIDTVGGENVSKKSRSLNNKRLMSGLL